MALMQFYLLEDASHRASTVPGTLQHSGTELLWGWPGSGATAGSFGDLRVEEAGSSALRQALSRAGCAGLSRGLGPPAAVHAGEQTVKGLESRLEASVGTGGVGG